MKYKEKCLIIIGSAIYLIWFARNMEVTIVKKLTIIFIIAICLAGPWAFAQGEEPSTDESQGSFVGRFQPRLGLLGGLMLPVGEVGSVMKAGFGGSVFGDLAVPLSFLRESGLVLRGGLMLGYSSVSSENTGFDAKVGLVPILVYADLGYPLDFGLTPSLRIGFGGTSVSLKDQSGGGNDASSFDATLQIGAAFGYSPFKNVEFLLNTGYAILFEEVNGSFVYLTLGAAYRL
jgi:hypothetical protein